LTAAGWLAKKVVKVTKNSTLAEILKTPGAKEVLAKYKLPCLWCPMAKFETKNLKIGMTCKMYNINLEGLLKDLKNLNKKLTKNARRLKK
jgi:hypothetical protein